MNVCETPARFRARRLRRDQTDVERRLWARLHDRRLSGVKFRRQHLIGPLIADVCCPERQLVVERDGGQHASRAEADQRRTAVLVERENAGAMATPSPPQGEREE